MCIDDFAIKKRQRYGTIMVDLESGEIVDMIPSREREAVGQWLRGYPNIAMVSRDGSLTYAQAIEDVHPEAIQISDRFHLVKNLNDRATQVFQRLLQGRVAIPITEGTVMRRAMLDNGTANERMLLVKEMHSQGQTNTAIAAMAGVSEDTIRRWSGRSGTNQTARGREHEEAVRKMQGRADRVRELRVQGMSISAIARETGFGYTSIKRYLSNEFTPVNGHYGKQREGKLEPYREEVLRLRDGGLKHREIHALIAAKGYTGTQDAIRGFLSKERRICADMTNVDGQETELLDKRWLIRLLYMPLEKVKSITQEQLSAVFATYPLAETVYALVEEFKTLMRSNEPTHLFNWMEAATKHGIAEIDAFVAGLRRDLDAVVNAILVKYSNGLAEGSVNKLKLIKRIMYGRCSFSSLRAKTLLLERYLRLN